MAQCATGKNRIPGQRPGVKIEHKTGTLNGLTTDVGYITLPDGRRLADALFARHGANRPSAIATAARTIYDGFRTVVAAPIAWTYQAAVSAAGSVAKQDPLAPLPVSTSLN